MDQTPQEELFYDDELHPLRSMIENGKGYKPTAQFLWPDMKLESAYARLKNCCTRPEKGEALKWGEILAAMRFNGRFDPVFHACDEMSLHRPKVKAPRDQAVDLQDRAERLLSELKQVMDRQERLTRAPLAMVKEGVR